ncbi:MAG TPA: FRG domain-containing protein [Candidatus Angelobacter sp.]|nr:FRG domain-containing protein [Candidatus Angelobacter sp.]
MADFLAAISNTVTGSDRFWFRGHHDVSFSLTPSALRYPELSDRTKALDLMADFKRIAAIKLQRPPAPNQELEWALIAQHHGLPTRLLDWTESATTALYFACLQDATDGIVFILNPVDLNRLTDPKKPRVLDPQHDSDLISGYLKMSGQERPNGRLPVAINPVWNSERLMMQKGVFTLHGNRFSLDKGNVPSLVGIPILRQAKQQLLSELERIGVDEMTLFPELEHSCIHLRRRAGPEDCK